MSGFLALFPRVSKISATTPGTWSCEGCGWARDFRGPRVRVRERPRFITIRGRVNLSFSHHKFGYKSPSQICQQTILQYDPVRNFSKKIKAPLQSCLNKIMTQCLIHLTPYPKLSWPRGWACTLNKKISYLGFHGLCVHPHLHTRSNLQNYCSRDAVQ